MELQTGWYTTTGLRKCQGSPLDGLCPGEKNSHPGTLSAGGRRLQTTWLKTCRRRIVLLLFGKIERDVGDFLRLHGYSITQWKHDEMDYRDVWARKNLPLVVETSRNNTADHLFERVCVNKLKSSMNRKKDKGFESPRPYKL